MKMTLTLLASMFALSAQASMQVEEVYSPWVITHVKGEGPGFSIAISERKATLVSQGVEISNCTMSGDIYLDENNYPIHGYQPDVIKLSGDCHFIESKALG